MATLLECIRRIVGAAALLVLITALPAAAQQPSSVNPEGSVVREQQMLVVTPRIEGRVSIPDTRESVLIQPFGRQWRLFHEVILPWFAGVSILATVLLLGTLYALRGPIRIEHGRSGRTLQRFNSFEHFLHWLVTFSFIILMLSGLNITFGKRLLLRGKMDKCTFCAGGPEADGSKEEFVKYGSNLLAEGKLPLCAEMCATKLLLAGAGDIIAQIYKERVSKRGYGSGAWGWQTAYGESITI